MEQKPWEKSKESLEWYKAAAKEIERQMDLYPDIAIPVDPDVAEFMGAFEEPCIKESDIYDDGGLKAWLKEQGRESADD
jgi:hypothetical protein